MADCGSTTQPRTGALTELFSNKDARGCGLVNSGLGAPGACGCPEVTGAKPPGQVREETGPRHPRVGSESRGTLTHRTGCRSRGRLAKGLEAVARELLRGAAEQ